MLNISACIITNNNHSVLNAIKSVYDSVNEIILVNTCEDFTIDLTEYDKVKLYSFDWCDDFSKARNYSISKAKKNYYKVRAVRGSTYSEFSNLIEYPYYYNTGILVKDYA